jgi:hypothetical protein
VIPDIGNKIILSNKEWKIIRKISSSKELKKFLRRNPLYKYTKLCGDRDYSVIDFVQNVEKPTLAEKELP